jgi:hypothetical protein
MPGMWGISWAFKLSQVDTMEDAARLLPACRHGTRPPGRARPRPAWRRPC